jgi:hypothetical protein
MMIWSTSSFLMEIYVYGIILQNCGFYNIDCYRFFRCRCKLSLSLAALIFIPYLQVVGLGSFGIKSHKQKVIMTLHQRRRGRGRGRGRQSIEEVIEQRTCSTAKQFNHS